MMGTRKGMTKGVGRQAEIDGSTRKGGPTYMQLCWLASRDAVCIVHGFFPLQHLSTGSARHDAG